LRSGRTAAREPCAFVTQGALLDLAGTRACLCVLCAYLVANAFGLLLWSRRSSLRAATALQIQLGITFVLALAALLVVDLRVSLAQLDIALSRPIAYGTLMTYPGLMFFFWMRNRVAPTN